MLWPKTSLFLIYSESTFHAQSNKSQAALQGLSLIKFHSWNLLHFLRRDRSIRLCSVQTAPSKCSGHMHVKSKSPALEPSVFQQDGRYHQVPQELRLISWQRILMWHLAAEKYHLSNGEGAVLWPGIIHSASGWQTGLVSAPVFRDTAFYRQKSNSMLIM